MDSEKLKINGFNWPNNSIRSAFVCVKGIEQMSNSGLINPKEIEVVIEILMQILRAGYIKMTDVGILTSQEE